MLTGEQKRYLRGLASTSKIKYQLGKNELSDSVIDMFEKAIAAHELIKIDVMKSVTIPLMEIALDLSSKLNAEIVQVVGKVIVLYRKNPKNPKIYF